jgi:hypothetical protein
MPTNHRPAYPPKPAISKQLFQRGNDTIASSQYTPKFWIFTRDRNGREGGDTNLMSPSKRKFSAKGFPTLEPTSGHAHQPLEGSLGPGRSDTHSREMLQNSSDLMTDARRRELHTMHTPTAPSLPTRTKSTDSSTGTCHPPPVRDRPTPRPRPPPWIHGPRKVET